MFLPDGRHFLFTRNTGRLIRPFVVGTPRLARHQAALQGHLARALRRAWLPALRAREHAGRPEVRREVVDARGRRRADWGGTRRGLGRAGLVFGLAATACWRSGPATCRAGASCGSIGPARRCRPWTRLATITTRRSPPTASVSCSTRAAQRAPRYVWIRDLVRGVLRHGSRSTPLPRLIPCGRPTAVASPLTARGSKDQADL